MHLHKRTSETVEPLDHKIKLIAPGTSFVIHSDAALSPSEKDTLSFSEGGCNLSNGPSHKITSKSHATPK